jgi:hypothetical protein
MVQSRNTFTAKSFFFHGIATRIYRAGSLVIFWTTHYVSLHWASTQFPQGVQPEESLMEYD